MCLISGKMIETFTMLNNRSFEQVGSDLTRWGAVISIGASIKIMTSFIKLVQEEYESLPPSPMRSSSSDT